MRLSLFRKHEGTRIPRPQSALARQLREQAVQRAKGARREALVLAALVVAVLVAYHYRDRWFGIDLPVRIASAIVLVLLGWAFARAVGRAAGPTLMKRLDSRAAGTFGFLIRLVAMAMTVLVAVDLVGLRASALVTGGAITAVVLGLAAQQTLGNVIAGIMVLSAHPFAVGDKVKFRAGGLAGELDGTVVSLGLLYTELQSGADRIMVPNNVVLSAAIVPLREPTPVDVLARLRPETKPSDIQAMLENAITTPTRTEPHVGLEEVDADEVVVRIAATPERNEDGARLADEVLAALTELSATATAAGNGHGSANGR
jgi:small conductance mechanosensitive channel